MAKSTTRVPSSARRLRSTRISDEDRGVEGARRGGDRSRLVRLSHDRRTGREPRVSRVGEELRRTFEAARRWRNFRLYLIGQLVSAAGTWMNFTASLRLGSG